MARRVKSLGPYSGSYGPSYALRFYRQGDPRKPLRGVNLRSVTAIQTSKSLADDAGTFTITLKDRRAREVIREMDVVRIRFRGHGQGFGTVLKGVVDDVRQGGAADTHAAQEDSVITGRCMAKYLMVTSLFLPVWDPQGVLPTALIFGLGDATKKVGGNTPRDIFDYLLRNYTFGKRNIPGISGIPNSRFWLSTKTRFNHLAFQVPFLQFDEDSMLQALKRLEIQGFTEAWVDELGHVVYRHPAWDAPISYRLPTSSMKNWSFSRSDLDVATYMEVIPAGDPGIDSAQAQALRAGRAPVPSAYIDSAEASIRDSVDREFVIATDSNGKVTAKGRRNHWYKRQRQLGMRPQQITSPLLFTQEQAQAQAQGLLEFYARLTKTGQVTIPGEPGVRLGQTIQLHGTLDGLKTNRTFYIEGVAHDYVEGDHYDTTLQLTHGRDPWDPKWGKIVLPKFDPSKLASDAGILDPGSGGTVSSSALRAALKGGDSPKSIIDRFVLPIGRSHHLTAPSGASLSPANNDAANRAHTHLGSASDHAGPPNVKWAADMPDHGSTQPTKNMDEAAKELTDLFGIPWSGSGLISHTADGYRFQIIYRYSDPQAGNHFGHIHFGVRKN